MKNGFELGRLGVSAGVYHKMQKDNDFSAFVSKSLKRYASCDWGDTDKNDKQSNDEAVLNGFRIFSAYNYIYGIHSQKIWIITEADRSSTTVIFPDEY